MLDLTKSIKDECYASSCCKALGEAYDQGRSDGITAVRDRVTATGYTAYSYAGYSQILKIINDMIGEEKNGRSKG